MDFALLEILACPLCKGQLRYDRRRDALICQWDKLVYPIQDGIPVLLPEEAQPWVENE